MNVAIVEATSNDAQIIATILSDAVTYKLDHKDLSWGSDPFTEPEVTQQLETTQTYLVYLESVPVGTFSLLLKDERTWGNQLEQAGYLHRLAIKKGSHGQGLGSQIIDWVTTEVARRQYPYLRLDCDRNNKKLCDYYETQDFKRVGTKHIESHDDYTAALYEKKVV